jgi:hypothetical protein
MKSIKTLLTGLLLLFITAITSIGGELTADIGIESKLFPKKAISKSPGQVNGSASIYMEYFLERYKQNEQIVIAPYFCLDFEDNERTHFDLRELYWQKNINAFEFSLGFRHVFWGVTESVHLVDIINQTDLVENIDGEDKLGQPMIQANWMSQYGTLSFYWLPYFRQRSFPGIDGRLRPIVPIDQSNSMYESNAKEWHQDWAVRWMNTIGQFDIGLAYFEGTERQPIFKPIIFNDGSLSLKQYYRQTKKLSLDILMVSGGWLIKSEILLSETSDQRHSALVTGFEYTIVGIAGSRYDLGLLIEYLYDERGSSYTPFEHDLFVGSRLAFNDIGGTSLLVGSIIDSDNGSIVTLAEFERRLTDWWSFEIETRLFGKQSKTDFLHDLRDDSYVRINLIRHW